ncbi:MAG TPA: alanine racemase [Thermomicrobiales bacterium]|nr:alanine racemase [Thermomicrobiales bacterium]
MPEQPDAIVKHIADVPGRSTRAIVDLGVIATNVEVIAREYAAEKKICAVVKGDGYGHGAVMVAKTALAAGATLTAVATVGEAANLRRYGISCPILILGPTDQSELPRAIGLGCELMIGSIQQLGAIRALSEYSATRPGVHLKIDTGMHRYGCAPDEAVSLARAIDTSGLHFAGIATHFHSADDADSSSAVAQMQLFQNLAEQIRSVISQTPDIHFSNSAGILHHFVEGAAIIRLGMGMYGMSPGPDTPAPASLNPALSVISRLARVHCAHPGDIVSYGQTFREEADERLGLVPLGYADGYFRILSNRAWMGVDGYQCPIRGRICMDQTVVGAIPESASRQSLVGVMGPLGGGPSLDELADLAGTINYEIAASISARVDRYYIRNGELVARLSEGCVEEFDA